MKIALADRQLTALFATLREKPTEESCSTRKLLFSLLSLLLC
jgi:hypothetical protein